MVVFTQVAKEIHRPYNRVYEDIKRLDAFGLVMSTKEFKNNREIVLCSAI